MKIETEFGTLRVQKETRDQEGLVFFTPADLDLNIDSHWLLMLHRLSTSPDATPIIHCFLAFWKRSRNVEEWVTDRKPRADVARESLLLNEVTSRLAEMLEDEWEEAAYKAAKEQAVEKGHTL